MQISTVDIIVYYQQLLAAKDTEIQMKNLVIKQKEKMIMAEIQMKNHWQVIQANNQVILEIGKCVAEKEIRIQEEKIGDVKTRCCRNANGRVDDMQGYL